MCIVFYWYDCLRYELHSKAFGCPGALRCFSLLVHATARGQHLHVEFERFFLLEIAEKTCELRLPSSTVLFDFTKLRTH